MLAMERLCYVFGTFAAIVGVNYGVWTGWTEPVGPVGLFLSAGLGYMIAVYLQITRKKLPAVPPEDDPLGEISDIAGEYGVFSPYSWAPLWLAGAAALIFLGLAVGWWIVAMGAVFAVPALIIWTFEYWRGPHSL